MYRPIDNIENGMVLGNDNEPRLSQYDIDFENQDDDRDNQWFDENARGGEDERNESNDLSKRP